MNNSDLYAKFCNAYNKCHPFKSKYNLQIGANNIWRSLKKEHSGVDFQKAVEGKIKSFNVESTVRKCTTITSFFAPKPSTSGSSQKEPIVPSTSRNDEKSGQDEPQENMMQMPCEVKSTNEITKTRIYDTPAQEKISKQIHLLESELNHELLKKNAGLENDESNKNIKKMKKDLHDLKKKLIKAKSNVSYQQTYRQSVKKKLEDACTDDVLKKSKTSGRPRLEEVQPELLDAIVQIAMFGSAAHERRRMEEIKSCRTLSDLHDKLLERNFKLSRSALYLRLLPKKSSTNEGKRHVTTVPVKLSRAQNDFHKQHVDGKFCTSTVRDLESLASFLGPGQVGFLSQDDKARVPIGITAAQKQAPILMHMQYQVRLPDHDWVIADRHKLIPSVYAGIIIKPYGLGSPEAVSYSGPTYIAIRSGKHSSSTAMTHAVDFERLLDLDAFSGILRNGETVKPVLIFCVDGGPDENPRYPKTISNAITHFRKHDINGLFIVTNAPGRSAFNRVERRMAPLSAQLSGVILPHDSCGSHLNNKGHTVDVELEKQNFANAGIILSQLWSELVIDGYPVTAEYISPTDEELEQVSTDPEWYAKHVREAQCLLQVVKCNDFKCCKPYRGNLHQVLSQQFIPPPIPVKYEESKIVILEPTEVQEPKFLPLFQRIAFKTDIPGSSYKLVPYDFYCPSLQSQIEGRVCISCGLYFASKKAAANHTKALKHNFNKKRTIKKKTIIKKRKDEVLCIVENDEKMQDVEWLECEDIDEHTEDLSESSNENVESLPVISSLDDWLKNPWSTE